MFEIVLLSMLFFGARMLGVSLVERDMAKFCMALILVAVPIGILPTLHIVHTVGGMLLLGIIALVLSWRSWGETPRPEMGYASINATAL